MSTKSSEMNYRSVLPGLFVSLLLYGAYFFNLVRNELQVLQLRQEALESLKILAVPGTDFLNSLGNLFALKSSFFYLFLIGMLLVVVQLLSLCLKRPWHRVVFFVLLLAGLTALVRGDRIAFSFPFVTAVSFSAFFFITSGVRFRTSWKDLGILVVLGLVVSTSLFLGAKEGFFVKARDRLLFDSRPGELLVSYYYTYSPLASALVSPARGVYGGLVFFKGLEGPFRHMGQGLVMSGDAKTRRGADFVVSRVNGGHVIEDRHGNKTSLSGIERAEILQKTAGLFAMNGFRTLNRISLYAFPAGLLVLPFFVLRMVTDRRKPFLVMSLAMGLVMVVFIGAVSITGTRGAPPTNAALSEDKGAALSLAYDLYERKELPSEFVPAILGFTRSDSVALRYWGARLLGYRPDDTDRKALLVDLMEDPSPNVRYAAAVSLHNILRADSFEHLLSRLLDEPNWYVKCIMFSAFLRSGTIPHRM